MSNLKNLIWIWILLLYYIWSILYLNQNEDHLDKSNNFAYVSQLNIKLKNFYETLNEDFIPFYKAVVFYTIYRECFSRIFPIFYKRT